MRVWGRSCETGRDARQSGILYRIRIRRAGLRRFHNRFEAGLAEAAPCRAQKLFPGKFVGQCVTARHWRRLNSDAYRCIHDVSWIILAGRSKLLRRQRETLRLAPRRPRSQSASKSRPKPNPPGFPNFSFRPVSIVKIGFPGTEFSGEIYRARRNARC